MTILYNLRGSIIIILILLHTLLWYPLLLLFSFIKLIPVKPVRWISTKILTFIATIWIGFNNLCLEYIAGIKIEAQGLDDLSKKEWYLVISNHQAWSDIMVLQKILNSRIPLLKFFLKQELIRVPLLGFAWWALDFPFMKRYSSEFIKKNPHLKGKDIEITRKACEKYKTMPVSIMNFVEGTRFNAEKHKKNSALKNLLPAKAGGTGFVFTAMGHQINIILNVTIIYPQGSPDFWSFICGKINTSKVIIEKIPVTADLIGDYQNDKAYRTSFIAWINNLWQEKDILIEKEKQNIFQNRLN